MPAWRAPTHYRLAAISGPSPLAPLGFRSPSPLTSHEASFDQRCVAEYAATARHVEVAAFPVNNRAETGKTNQRSFPTATGWCVVRTKPSSFRPTPAKRRAGTHNLKTVVMGPRNGAPATHSASLRAFTPVFDGLWTRGNALLRSRGTPLAGTTRVGFVALVSPKCAGLALRLTMSNSPSRSRGAFSAPGVLHRCFAHPERGWAERRETFGCSAEHPWGLPSCVKDARERAYDAAGQAPSEAPCVP